MFESLVPRALVAFKPVPPTRRRSPRKGYSRPAIGQFRRAELLEARCFLSADPIVTVDTNFGNFKLELFASAAPKTVANFLTYVDSGAYNNSIIQRDATSDGSATGSPFVIQGGGYTTSSTTFTSGSQLTAVTPGATVPDESHADNPNNPNINTTGTIAMALSSGPNSGTNQWFINLANNSFLDGTSDGGPFTVFGQVIDNGMSTVINPTVAKLTGGNNGGYPSENPPVAVSNQLVVISSMTVDSIDGTVFTDTNGNGTMDSGETGIAGRTVFLNNDGTGAPDASNPSTTTDANGNYSFSGLTAGTYTVSEVLPGGVTLTTPTQTVTVAANQTASGANFGENPNVVPAGTIAASGTTFTATQGAVFSGNVATFIDPVASDTATQFTASIDWGDGATSAGTVNGSNGAFTVAGSHTYSDDGADLVSVTITQASLGTETATAASSADVLDADLTAIGVTATATQGTPFAGTVATFTDPDDTAGASAYAATINWGDGVTSAGTVTGSGTFTISGTHTYAFGSDFSVQVQISDNTSSSTPAGTVTSLISVPNTDTLSATGGAALSQTENQTTTSTLATFTDLNSVTPSSDFTATIDWGDGEATTTGTVTGSAGLFTVTANHAFPEPGTFTVQVTIATNASSGPTATASTTATVADANTFTAQAATFNATEGTEFDGAVATFHDSNTASQGTGFTANINWGDGIDSVGTVSGSNGTFTVSGIHNYAEDGSFTAQVTLTDTPGTVTATANSTADVANAGLTVTAVSVTAIEGQTFSGTMATFTDASTGDAATQFAATINWGDGTSSTGSVTGSAGTFTVAATHAYGDYGDFTASVQVADTQSVPAVTATATSSATVSDANTLTAVGTSIAATATATFTGTVATFTDSFTGASAAVFTATINWGDGSSSTGTVTGSAGAFTVSGSHVYSAVGTDSVSVSVSDVSPGTATATASSTAQVAASPLSATAVNVNVTQGLSASSVVVATFSDANTSDTAAQFTATIDWGDGTTADSTGTVTGGNGSFTVTGNHTYADPGHENLTVTVLDSAGPSTTVNPTAVIGSADERFIGELYRVLLDREAESTGFAYWDNLMSGGTTQTQVIQSIEKSLEFEIDMGNELYEHYLNRTMDATSVTAVTTALSTGTFEQEAETIDSSDEFFNDSGDTADGWLTALYTDALNRAIDASALATFSAMNLSDPTVRAQVAAQVFGGSEYQTDLINSPSTTTQKYNQGVPTGFYQMFLNRAADSAGLAAAQAQFTAGQTDLQVMATILASDEFFTNL